MHPLQGHKRQRVGPDGSGLRTAVACRACRERKTRCSGHQPTCTYCLRANISCEYAPGSVSFVPQRSSPISEDLGEKILTAIGNLSSQLGGNFNRSNHRSPGSVNADDPSLSIIFDDSRDGLKQSDLADRSRYVPIERPCPVTGLPSIIKWKCFSGEDRASAPFQLPSFEGKGSYDSQASGRESASCSSSDLIALTRVFENHLLAAMPILDMAVLRAYITQIAEYGIAWSSESCLVLLVAALASMHSLAPHSSAALQRESPHLGDSIIECTPSAIRYWIMSKKRLGWVLEGPGLLAAQCQFLAGVWYLYNLEPVAAWKMFTGALLAIDAATTLEESERSAGGAESTDPTSLEEAIRDTCLWFICKLRSELNVSVAPSTYKLGSQVGESQTPIPNGPSHIMASGEVSFYSEDLNLLQIRQNTLAVIGALKVDMSIAEVYALHAKLKSSQDALDNWYSSLPPRLQFSIFEEPGIQRVPEDYHRTLLHSRYLETKELILRPSLYILLHAQSLRLCSDASDGNTLQDMMRSYLESAIREMCRQHYTLVLSRLKLCLSSGVRQLLILDEGWILIHTSVSLALMLLAADSALDVDSLTESGTFSLSSVSAIEDVKELIKHCRPSAKAEFYSGIFSTLLQR